MSSPMSSASLLSKTAQIGWSKLATAWSPQLLSSGNDNHTAAAGGLQAAVERTLPLLTDGAAAVPFVCRYRTDVIAPLRVDQIHLLAEWLAAHQSLSSTREKILPHIVGDQTLKLRVETCHSKAELDDLYAPFKPPSKGSLEDRIRKEHPNLIEAVDRFFNSANDDNRVDPCSLHPKEAAVTLLANRMASHPAVMDALLTSQSHKCILKVEQAAPKADKDDDDGKYAVYYDMERPVYTLRDYQVLAIRRGVDQKALKMQFIIDAEKAQGTMQWALRDKGRGGRGHVWKDAIHEAWTRLLRKRFTTRLWRDKCTAAQARSIQVFCDNLRKALLAPPPIQLRPLLALDPGYKAGIKCALLHADGRVVDDDGLETVHFVSNKDKGRKQLVNLLQRLKELDTDSNTSPLWVIVGNGHGTQEAQQLVKEAGKECNTDIDVKLVNEAGASVWSVEPSAAREFPNHQAASIAAVSIGRRYLNPLAELVKIPPRSLGLGMYQHDLSGKELDEKLHLTSVDAVAEVGVDVNGGSLEILAKVPGLTTKLVEQILKQRPLNSRQDLLKISGLGPKTFEHCAAFLRVNQGSEPLDRTLCHPESYDLAQYLLEKMKWDLDDKSSLGLLPCHKDRSAAWSRVARKAATEFDVSVERVLLVLDHLVVSLLNPDPRLRDDVAAGSVLADPADKEADFHTLPTELVPFDALRKACPVRDIEAVVRNVLDFGIFVDFGGESDGLLHRSKLGSRRLSEFMIGQTIGVDILGVSSANRASISLAGLGCPAESLDNRKRPASKDKKSSSSNKRMRLKP